MAGSTSNRESRSSHRATEPEKDVTARWMAFVLVVLIVVTALAIFIGVAAG
jgi:hypothetical protein